MKIRIRSAKNGEAKERKIKTTIDGVNKAIAHNKDERPDTIPAHKNQIDKLKDELKEQKYTVIHHPVEKRGGRWGWFRQDGAYSSFVAPGNVYTKKSAVEARKTHAEKDRKTNHVILKEAFGQFGSQHSADGNKDNADPDKDKKQKEKDSFADFYRGYDDKDELKQKVPDKLILFPSKKDLVEKIIQLRKKGL